MFFLLEFIDGVYQNMLIELSLALLNTFSILKQVKEHRGCK